MDWLQIKEARRRLQREQGTVFKDWGGKLPFALIYPNTYHLGMSNLGIHVLYRLLNSYPHVVCERVFWSGKGQQAPLSLESQRPLSDFAVLAFSISYEMDYINVVSLLRSSGLPPLASQRNESHPLVIAGGPCIMANPQPVAPLFDCLAIGEGEAILPSMIKTIDEGIPGHRTDLLQALAALPGAYVPGYSQGKITRQWVENLDDFATTSVVLTHDTELGEMYLLEIARGCPRRCRFCLAGFAFLPLRSRSVPRLLEQAREGLRHRRRLGLVGAAVSDYPHIEELVSKMRDLGAELSFSSLRIKPLPPVLVRALAESGSRTITLAPEAGSERLRRSIRKGVSEEDIFKAMKLIAQYGLPEVKLYFMIGLPTETDEDILEIATLAGQCQAILDQRRTRTRLILNVSPFVPKGGTPFERLPMAPPETLKRRLALLRGSLGKGIEVKTESIAWSQVQAFLARGDEGAAEVLVRLEENSLSAWRRTAAEVGQDIAFWAHREWAAKEPLPWERVNLDGLQPCRLGSALPPTHPARPAPTR